MTLCIYVVCKCIMKKHIFASTIFSQFQRNKNPYIKGKEYAATT